MRAAMIEDYGDNGVVQLIETDPPAPGPGQLLVKVRAAGINPIDWKIREGAGGRMGLELPIRLGSEAAGTVERLGPGVTGFAPGDAVFGMTGSGAFADYVAVDAAAMTRTPAGMDLVQAAAIPLAALTAWQALFDVAGLEAGQRLLVTGGSGGVGSMAVQLAKAHGAHVTAMASGANADYVRGLGADVFVDYTVQPFEDVLRDLDVVFDTVGGDTFERAFRVLRPGGILVTAVTFPSADLPRRDVRAARVFARPDADQLAAIRALVEAGQVRPHVAAVLPLAQLREALTRSQGGRTRGKIVLDLGA